MLGKGQWTMWQWPVERSQHALLGNQGWMFACVCRRPLTWSSSCGRTTKRRVSRLLACACLPSAIHRPAVAGAVPACLSNRLAAAALPLPPQQPALAAHVKRQPMPLPPAANLPVFRGLCPLRPADNSPSLKYLRAVRAMFEQLSPEVRTTASTRTTAVVRLVLPCLRCALHVPGTCPLISRPWHANQRL